MNTMDDAFKAYQVDYIAFEDRAADTAVRVAKECLERQDFMFFNLPDMPRLSAEPKRRFMSAFGRR